MLSDARAVREQHLRNLGTRSYGSAVRRYLDGITRVAVIGRGALAADVIPYVDEGRLVDQWTREDLSRASSRAAAYGRAAIIVAAPVRATDIEAVAKCYPGCVRIIDLRAADQRDALACATVITLDDVLAAVEASTRASEQRVETARREIRRLAAAFDQGQLLRPFGWDDLCA